MKELRILAKDGIWCVEHLEDGQPDKEIMGLFDGEHVLPTPYTTAIPLRDVMSAMRRLNPGSRVFSNELVRSKVVHRWDDKCGGCTC